MSEKTSDPYEAKFCPECGSPWKEASKFCVSCGKAFQLQEAQSAAVKPVGAVGAPVQKDSNEPKEALTERQLEIMATFDMEFERVKSRSKVKGKGKSSEVNYWKYIKILAFVLITLASIASMKKFLPAMEGLFQLPDF